MRTIKFTTIFLFIVILCKAQNLKSDTYNYSATKTNDLVHTKLDISFDFEKMYVYGKEWITIKPHFHPTDSLQLDAQGMKITNISLSKGDKLIPLKYSYDNLKLDLKLDKVYNRDDNFTLYIEYIAKQDKIQKKGVHFVNADGKDNTKPTQIWTLGQPEKNSTWFPTIDKPNQKTTQEISITVPDKYVTLSNGSLISQKITDVVNKKRTDTWKLENPHAPYLAFFAIGEFKVIKDYWKGKEISYYLEPQFAQEPNIQNYVFPNTVEAIEYFSRMLGVDYPWSKYSQIKLRNFPGAMENTTASAFNENGESSIKELADENYQSGNIHELFHQWFGDYVTAESWANIALNESFADLSEILWAEHKYGKDVADAHIQKGLQGYLIDQNGWNIPLIRYDYPEASQMFNGITYQKGGRILNMLRHFLGNDIFEAGLQQYLKQNAYGTVEADDLRIVLEQVSGMDLNWFFNEWFFGAGHPILDISYEWNEKKKETQIIVKQEQDKELFTLPISIDIYENNIVRREKVWLKSKIDTLNFRTKDKPKLINVDAEKVLIAKKFDHKTLSEFEFQYKNAPLYLDRYEALEFAKNNSQENVAQKILFSALEDNFSKIRLFALQSLDTIQIAKKSTFYTIVKKIALNDNNNIVKAKAIEILGNLKDKNYETIFERGINIESYAIQGASLIALGKSNPKKAIKIANEFETDNKRQIYDAILFLYTRYGDRDEWNFINGLFQSYAPPKKYNIIKDYGYFTGRIENPELAKQGIEEIKKLGIIGKKFGVDKEIIEILEQIKKDRKLLNDNESAILVDKSIAEIKNTE